MTNAWIIAGMSGFGGTVGAMLRVAATETLRTVTARRKPRIAAAATAGALAAVLSAVLALRIQSWPALSACVYLAAVGVSLATIDVVERRLPDSLIRPSYLVIATLIGLDAITRSEITPAIRATLGMAAVAALHLAVAILSRGGLGAGDVKLGGLLGLTLAWHSWTSAVVGTVLGWVLAAVALLGLRLACRWHPDQTVTLGPFLLLGAFIALALSD